ncbi:MAG: hypothetical protein Q9162_004518 [Coniocarpon cinnabarinum]
MTTSYPSSSLATTTTGYPTPVSSTGSYASNNASQKPQHNKPPFSMDARPSEYSQSGMVEPQTSSPPVDPPSSHAPQLEPASETVQSLTDPNSASHFPPGQEVKYNPATPDSNYSLNPQSARSGTFPDSYLNRSTGYPDGSQRYQQGSNSTPNGATGNMAQPTSPSSMPSNNSGQAMQAQQGPPSQAATNPEIPVDPSIAQSSPTYPPQHHYSPYPTPDSHHMNYQTPPMYPRPPDYNGPPYSAPHQPIPYGHAATSVSPPSNVVPAGARLPGVSIYSNAFYEQGYNYRPQGGHPLSTVYSFVPIPGTHQQKRPRRRYEEIERMYKCGWNGCEKAYGTLNHLNAHVTMQSHGSKRTPEEFKEIRKEWKQRKKEEENQRKADEERARQQAAQQQPQHPDGPHTTGPDGAGQPQHASAGGYGQGGVRQLPPIGYAPASGQVASQYSGQAQAGMEGMPQYPGGQVPYQPNYPPPSPYGQQPPNQMYAHPSTQQPLQNSAAAPPNPTNHQGEQGRS